MAGCLEEARRRGEISATADVRKMADLLVDCWEGAALRTRLRRDPSSLTEMLDFYISSVTSVQFRAEPANPHRRRWEL
jgi:TetR/AcrR family transcriptional regulator, transcriptional repressor for nem operon